MELKFRLYTPEDVPVISELWQSSTEWGALSPAMISRHLDNAPFGKPIVTVAENVDTGKIVGQAVLMPSLISVKGNLITAFRPVAPILERSLRVRSLNPLQHPIVRLFQYGFEEMRNRGEKLVFMLPDPRWMMMFRLLPDFRSTSFPLWSLRLPMASPFPSDADYTASELTNWDQRVDKLFAKAAGQYACMVMRNADALRKKSGPPEYEVLGVERSGELVGVVASKQKGDGQWLICDFMAADSEAERATLKAVCNLAHRRATARSTATPIHKAGILAPPRLLPALRELGFSRDQYDFHLVLKILDGSLSADDVDPSLWYLSAND